MIKVGQRWSFNFEDGGGVIERIISIDGMVKTIVEKSSCREFIQGEYETYDIDEFKQDIAHPVNGAKLLREFKEYLKAI